MRDYYEVLGLPKNSSLEEIKKAYRNLARKHHPDVDKSTGAEERFKEINEAYQILSDPKKKEAYDRYGHAAFAQGAGAGSSGAGFNPFGGASGQWGPFTYSYSTDTPFGSSESGFSDPFDIFESVFGFRGFNSQRRGRDLNYVMDIDFSEAVNGSTKIVEVSGNSLTVNIPQGSRTGTKIKFEGLGERYSGKDSKSTPSGDLYITLRVGPHPKFYREGDDIYSEELVKFSQLVLGSTIDVETVYEIVKLKVPQGSQPGTEFRIKGKGVKSRRGQGDHYVRLGLTVPKNLTREQKELMDRMQNLGL